MAKRCGISVGANDSFVLREYACEMAQQVKTLAAKPGNQISLPETNVIERELTPHKLSYDLHTFAMLHKYRYIRVHTHTHTLFKLSM